MAVPATRRWTLAFWVVFAAAAALRMIRLSSWDLWTDEANTFWTAVTGEYVSGPMYASAPVNFLLTKLAIAWLGPNELGARIVPFLAGTATIGLAYFAMRRWIGPRAAFFASLVLTLSIWHLYWSQTARHFSLETLFLLGAVHAFVRFWREGSKSGLALAALLVLAALFTHSSAGFYLAALLGFVIASWAIERRTRGLGAPWSRDDGRHALALAALSIVLVAYMPVYLAVGSYTLEHRTAWNPPWNIVGSLVFYIPPYLALPALAGLVFLYREARDLALLALSWIAVPFVLVTVASSLTIASASYCLPSMLAISALAGVAGDRILREARDASGRWGSALVLGGVLAAMAYDATLYFSYYHGLKPRWKALCETVERARRPGELFLAEEGDVAQFYVGRERAEWLGRFEREIGTAFPPEDARGVWYGVYLTDSTILRRDDRVLGHLLGKARLVRLFPLHYGPKDRTLALFHEDLAARPVSAP